MINGGSLKRFDVESWANMSVEKIDFSGTNSNEQCTAEALMGLNDLGINQVEVDDMEVIQSTHKLERIENPNFNSYSINKRMS